MYEFQRARRPAPGAARCPWNCVRLRFATNGSLAKQGNRRADTGARQVEAAHRRARGDRRVRLQQSGVTTVFAGGYGRNDSAGNGRMQSVSGDIQRKGREPPESDAALGYRFGDRCSLTFDLSGRRRQDAGVRLAKMYRVPPARTWWPDDGAPLEREAKTRWGVGTHDLDTWRFGRVTPIAAFLRTRVWYAFVTSA